MHYLGEEAYLGLTERVNATRRAIEAGLRPLGTAFREIRDASS